MMYVNNCVKLIVNYIEKRQIKQVHCNNLAHCVNLLVGLKTALVNPGPDLIICDEGHRIKNSCAGISQSLKNIKTRYVGVQITDKAYASLLS